jgi:hypothetical protein
LTNAVLSLPHYPTGEDLKDVAWRSFICHTCTENRKASADLEECFHSYRESYALSAIYIEQHSKSKYLTTSPKEILREVQELVPDLRWRPSRGVLEGNIFDDDDLQSTDQIWAEMKTYVDLKADSCLKWVTALALFTWDRDFFQSRLGYVGWIPCHAMEGDMICAFYGSRYPFVVRPYKGAFRLIGACYMHGIMEGEAVKLPAIYGNGDALISIV